jgi:AcrR family transcriptional regulator
MPRLSSKTDARLLKAGRDLLPETGISRMNIRQVARKARVNLGMFHYHFKTKDAFARRVLQEFYEELFHALETEAANEGTPLERLRAVIYTFGCFARDNRRLLLALLRDIALGEPATIDFVRANLHRHVELILRLTAQALAARQIGPIEPVNALSMLMSATNLPSIFAEVIHRFGLGGPAQPLSAALSDQVLSNEAIADRVDAILIGLVAQCEDIPPRAESNGAAVTAEPDVMASKNGQPACATPDFRGE